MKEKADEALITRELSVNGLCVEASYTRSTVEDILIPLLSDLSKLWKKKKRRIIAFLAGPPASGKSTLALCLEEIWKERMADPNENEGAFLEHITFQALGLDGFHYDNHYLQTHTCIHGGEKISLSRIKGAPETFDFERLCKKLEALRKKEKVPFPVYDRKLHEPVQGGVTACADIILLEGNWLLLDEDPWRMLRAYADFTISIRAPLASLTGRLVERKVRGGLALNEAEKWVAASDSPNVRRCLEKMLPADLELLLKGDGELGRAR